MLKYGIISVWRLFYKPFYNHAHQFRLKKLFYVGFTKKFQQKFFNLFWIQVVVLKANGPLRNRTGSETATAKTCNSYISDLE
jgi:hypothetical protein